MYTSTVEAAMSDEQGRNPASATVKIDPELLKMAKQIVSFEGGKLSKLLDDILRGPIVSKHEKIMKKIAKQHGGD